MVRLLITGRMRDLAVGYRVRMRTLSLGPVAWGFWSWTFHDGSCWASCAFDGDIKEDRMIGWAGVTYETDVLPVIGVYVHEDHRGTGLAERLVTTLIQELIGRGVLSKGDALFASTWRWKKYQTVVESLGLRCLSWT